MLFNQKHKFIVSIDDTGMIDFWSNSDFEFPESAVKFEMITDTDYVELIEDAPIASCFSHSENILAVICKSFIVRFFDVCSGKLLWSYNDDCAEFLKQNLLDGTFQSPAQEKTIKSGLDKRLQTEKEL